MEDIENLDDIFRAIADTKIETRKRRPFINSQDGKTHAQ
jgi:hypothetical protein